MKIYLDIDDTLINTDIFNIKPANHLKEFLSYMLKNHDVFWLTTHCQGDATRAVLYMSQFVTPDIVDLIMRIKPTKWTYSKLQVINLDEDFLWFEDAPLSLDEEKLLQEKGKMGSYVKVDLDENPDILKEFISYGRGKQLEPILSFYIVGPSARMCELIILPCSRKL